MAVFNRFQTFRGSDIAKLETEINNYLLSQNLDQPGGILNSVSLEVAEPGNDQVSVQIISVPGSVA